MLGGDNMDQLLLDSSGSTAGVHGHRWPWPWDQPGMVSPELCLGMAVICILSEALYGATSFGPAITFNCGWQILYLMGIGDGTLTTVAIHMTVMETFSAALQCLLLRKLADPWLLLATSGPCCVCIFIGQYLMIALDGVWLKRALGLILFIMMLQRVWANRHLGLPCGSGPAGHPAAGLSEQRHAEKTTGAREQRKVRCGGLDLCRTRTLLSTLFWFSMAGALGGITSIGGPPMMLFVSIHADELDLHTWRGTNGWLRLLLNVSRGIVFLLEDRFDFAQRWPLDVGMILGGWVGLVSGNFAARYLKDASSLHWPMTLFLSYAAVSMGVAGSGDQLQRNVSLVSGGAALFAAVLVGVSALWRRQGGGRGEVRMRIMSEDLLGKSKIPVSLRGSLRDGLLQ